MIIIIVRRGIVKSNRVFAIGVIWFFGVYGDNTFKKSKFIGVFHIIAYIYFIPLPSMVICKNRMIYTQQRDKEQSFKNKSFHVFFYLLSILIGSIQLAMISISFDKVSAKYYCLKKMPKFIIVILFVAVWTPRLQLLKEVVALVIDQDERREILYCNLPDCLHAELRILNALDALDAAL